MQLKCVVKLIFITDIFYLWMVSKVCCNNQTENNVCGIFEGEVIVSDVEMYCSPVRKA